MKDFVSGMRVQKRVAGACRNRTHPAPFEATAVLKTEGHTSTHSLPIRHPLYLSLPQVHLGLW